LLLLLSVLVLSAAPACAPDPLSLIAELAFRLSVAYQPLPLKTTRGAWSTRFATPLPHSSQVCEFSASNPWRSS
jgi:hypothetical protein